MIKKIIIASFLTVCAGQTAQSQEYTSYISDYNNYNQALALFESGHYELAQISFDELELQHANTELQSNSAYFSSKCALLLQQENAEQKMQRFIKKFPTSSKVVLAYLDLSTYYFNQEDYNKSFKYAQKVNQQVLSDTQRQQLTFQEAYAAFQTKKIFTSKNGIQKDRFRFCFL